MYSYVKLSILELILYRVNVRYNKIKEKQKIEKIEHDKNKSTGYGMIHPRSYLLPMQIDLMTRLGKLFPSIVVFKIATSAILKIYKSNFLLKRKES